MIPETLLLAVNLLCKCATFRVSWQAEVPVVKVELLSTCDSKNGQPGPTWLWESQSVQFGPGSTSAETIIPNGATQWFFNITDERGLLISAFE
jgi:hypothetical protein